MPRDVNGQPSGEAPQNCHEGYQRDHSTHAADRESEAAGDELWNVLLDALVGIVDLAGAELQAVVDAFGEPGVQILVG